jgi:hypothetical protein
MARATLCAVFTTALSAVIAVIFAAVALFSGHNKEAVWAHCQMVVTEHSAKTGRADNDLMSMCMRAEGYHDNCRDKGDSGILAECFVPGGMLMRVRDFIGQ